jgi:hypothetical protein
MVLAQLVVGRLPFNPRREGQRRFYEFTGTGTVRLLLEGVVDTPVTMDGVPNGIRTRVLALKGPRPGPLDDGDDERTDGK